MNIDDIIKAINDSSYDDNIPHDVETPTPELKAERQKRIDNACSVSPEVVAALAEHIGAQKPEDLLPLIQRLTTEVEKKRLSFVNQKLRSHAAFNEAMAKLHEWRGAQKPTPPAAQPSAMDEGPEPGEKGPCRDKP